VRFRRKVAALSRKAMALKRRRGEMSGQGYAVACGRVEAAMDRLSAGAFTDPDNARLAKRLRKHQDSLFVFLERPGVEATNNLAEREVRPAVIARKLSAGNRMEAGAETHSVLASVLRTCRRQGVAILQSLTNLLKHGPGHVLDLIKPQPSPTR
jgi:transposase